MIRTWKFCATALCAFVLCLAAAERPYEEMMKELAGACTSLKNNLDAKSMEGATADAAKLEKLFKEMEKFWSKKKVADATQWAKDGGTAARMIVKASKAGNGEEMMTQFKNLTGTCKSCHDVHREKGPDGKWQIKI